MKNKIKVLRIITSLDPEYGGPSKAIIDSSISLVSQGFKIDILTGDAKNSNFFKSKNIVCDFRKPNVIRVAPCAFYNSYADVYHFVESLNEL